MIIVGIPETVKTTDSRGGGKSMEIPFTDWLRDVMDMYAPEKRSLKMIRQAQKIEDKLSSVNGEETIAFEDADFDLVKAASEASINMWANLRIARSFQPYYDALEAATSENE